LLIIFSYAGQQVLHESTMRGNPVIIGMREIFTKIACTPYLNDDPKSSYEFTVNRQNGVISISAPTVNTSMVDKLSYHNFQFAKKCTEVN
jgi:hypothetical protein